MACLGISQGAAFDCADPLQPFVRQRLLVGNLDDIATITRNITEDNIIEAITMDSTKAMFAFEGAKASISAQAELVAGGFTPQYNHMCSLLVFEVDSLSKANLQAMAAVDLFCIVENSTDTSLGNSVFEVFGIARGQNVESMIRINADTDTSGAYSVVLNTPEIGGRESTLPDSFFITDEPTSRAAVDALLIPAL